jgi:tetratricopeptide (TPR) repeat protein
MVTWSGSPVLAQEDMEAIRWQRQIAFVQALIDAEPSLPMHYQRMAQAYARLGVESDVLRYSEEAVVRGASPIAVDILIGDFYANQGRYDEAIARYLRVLDVAPQQAHVLTQIWFILQRNRDSPLGLAVRVEDITTRMNNAGYYISESRGPADSSGALRSAKEGNRLLNGGDVRGSIQAYKRSADQDSWNAVSYRGMAVAYARQRDYPRAIGAYHLYLALAAPGTPDVPKVRQIIIDYYRRAR